MRSFSKKLAFVLAAAMVVTSFAPAAKAEAAKEMAINKSSQILYVNEGINHKGADGVAAGKGNVSVYDFSVKNKPADWKDTLSFKWSTKDNDVVTVKAGGVVTAVGVGKATVTCTVTDKATKETVATLKTKVTVKANAYDVEITNADDVAGLAYEVGSTIDLNRAMYDEDGNKTSKRGKLVTDYTRWIAEPATGVEITQSNGKYTFTEAGEYTLYCETYQSSKYKNTTATSEKIKVTIEDTSLEFKQTTLKKFDITLGSAATLAAADVTVDEVVVGASGEHRVNALVKGVTMSEDKKTATVELFYDMKDGVSYEVTVKGYDKAAFVASAGKPVAIVAYATDSFDKTLVAGQAVVGQLTKLKYTLIDANNVDVTTGTDAEKNKVVFDLKYTGVSGTGFDMAYYGNYADFNFSEVGDIAVVTAKYDDGDYETEDITSSAITLYAIAKQQILVKAVTNYTTQTKDYNNYWDVNKDVVKLSYDGELTKNNNYLAIEVALADGKKMDIYRQGQTIVDGENVPHGYVTVEVVESSRDYIDVDAFALGTEDKGSQYGLNSEPQKIILRPRKVGTAQLMVYYNAYLPDGNIQKMAVAPITLKVKEAPVLGSVQFNSSGQSSASVVLSIYPQANSLKFGGASIQLKDQYGNDVNYEYVRLYDLVGTNDAADALVDNGISIVENYNDEDEFTGYSVAVDSTNFRTKIKEMNDTTKDTISGKFNYTVKFQDTNTWEIKTGTIVVDIRALTANNSYTIGTDFGANSTSSGNIARISANDPWNAKAEKFISFQVFDKMNGANFDLQTIRPYIGRDVNSVTAGYYVADEYLYRVFRNGKNVTEELAAKLDAQDNALLTFDGNNTVTLRFSGTKYDANGKLVVDYTDVGAGSYQFVVYKVENSKYSNGKLTANPVSSANKTVSVSCDPGKYSYVGRDNTVIKNDTGLVPSYTGTDELLAVLKCFNFANRGGAAFNKDVKAKSYGGDPNSNTLAVFGGGESANYVITFNEEEREPNSVFVDKVTFYEELGTIGEGDEAEKLYASYEVKVGCFVDYVKAQ